MLDELPASPVVSTSLFDPCPRSTCALGGPHEPEWLSLDELVTLSGRSLRALQRMVARWHRDGRDPRTSFPYPRVDRRARPCGGVEWVVRRDDVTQYFPAWFDHA